MKVVKVDGFVSPMQVAGYDNPLTEEVAAAAETHDDATLRQLLIEIATSRGLMTTFLPLPFAADSRSGQRISAAWKSAADAFPGLRKFTWRFWQPEADSRGAAFMQRAIGSPMIPVSK